MKVQIEIGAMCDPISEQLKSTNLDGATLSLLDADCEAINRLYIRRYISEAAFKVAGKKLIKNIQESINRAQPQPQPEARHER